MRRSRLAQLVVWVVYVGIPVIFLALTLLISALADSDVFNWQAGLIPLAVILGGWFFRGRSRYRPTRWATAGAMTGGVTGLFTVFYTIVLDGPGVLFLPGAIIGGLIGYGIGWYGARTLLRPAVAELAETPYVLTFTMRRQVKLSLVLDGKNVSLQTSIRIRTADGDSTSVRANWYPLDAVQGVRDVMLSGTERLEYPIAMDKPPVSSPGPALILTVGGADWILPHDEAPVLAQIVNRRISAA